MQVGPPLTQDALHVAIYQPPDLPPSFRVYLHNVLQAMPANGLRFSAFAGRHDLPADADLLWDIRSGGGNPPPEDLLATGNPPLVVTIHGFAPMSLPGRDYFGNWREQWHARGSNRRKRAAWHGLQGRIAQVVAVSNFTRDETVRITGIGPDRISVCPHGVDGGLFQPGAALPVRPRFLHVSNDEPRKNIARIVAAFARLRMPQAELVLKVPRAAASRYAGLPGVQVIAEHISDAELAALYRSATAFVFPSLYEGFGLPILEAMASGCPVITSHDSACGEVAGEAALRVDPRRTGDLAQAMQRLLDDATLHRQCVDAGLRRAAAFTWQASAQHHAAAFRVGAAAGSAHNAARSGPSRRPTV
jgi:glycosyltransferase involved in cell wall biosynthesis